MGIGQSSGCEKIRREIVAPAAARAKDGKNIKALSL
jgi:hypothetical protein